MTVALRTTAAGVFYDHDKADKAVEALLQAGFRKEDIGVATRQPAPATGEPQAAHTTHAEDCGAAGVLTGGVLGVLGGVLGAGAVAAGVIPGVGPVITAGILAAALAGGAAAGAVAGGLIGTLIGLGIPEEEAHFYQGEFEAGRTILTVRTGPRYDEAVAILRRCGAYGKGSPLI